MKNGILLFMLLSFATMMSQNSETSIIDLATLQSEVIGKDVQFVDVRTPEEYEAGHIDDAINIDMRNEKGFKNSMEKLDKDRPIYIYCRTGGRSGMSAKVLSDMGFKEVYDFSGGWKAWSANE